MSLLDAYACVKVRWVHKQESQMALRRPKITTEERQAMQQMRSEGCSYRVIAKSLGRTYNGVRSALNPEVAEKARQATASRRAQAKAADPEAYYAKERQQLNEYHQRRPELKMLYSARESAKRQGLPFDLEESDIVIPECCPVLGIAIEKASGSRTYNSPSLDKLIPALGYVKGNVQVISWRANKLKGEGTAKEHRLIAEWMESNGAS